MPYSEFFSDEEFEHCWIPERAGGSFYDSEEIAVREIHADFPWSRDVTRLTMRCSEPDESVAVAIHASRAQRR